MKTMKASTLFIATSARAVSVTGPAALSSCETWISTAGDDDMVMAPISAAVSDGTPSHTSTPHTPSSVNAPSRPAAAIRKRELITARTSSDKPSRYRIRPSAMSISTRDPASVSAEMMPSPLGPSAKPTSMKPVMLGSHS